MTANYMLFEESVKGCVVGRFRAGKTRLCASAFTAQGVVDFGHGPQQVPLLAPALVLDCDGGAFSLGPLRGQPEEKVRYVGVSTRADFLTAIELLQSGYYRFAFFDGWTKLYGKLATEAMRQGKGKATRNAGYNLEAADQVALCMDDWLDLAVRPNTRGIVLLSTAAVTDAWEGDIGSRHIVGERLSVSPRIEDRIVGGHNFIWQAQRMDPSPIRDDRGYIDVEATNRGFADGTLAPRFLVYTQPMNGQGHIKSQEGFAEDVAPIAERLDLGHVLSAHHERYGKKVLHVPPVAA